MKTTEIFVEQVLIGFMVLLVGALVFWGDVYAFALKRSDKSLDLIVTGGILIGVAYLIGMVYDRIADTLLQDLEAHGRLQFALARFKFKSGKIRTKVYSRRIKGRERNVQDLSVNFSSNIDPFEDGRSRIMVFSNSEATAQVEYLRSRIRLTRALATIIPGVTIATLLAVDNGDAGIWWIVVALTIPFAYAATLFLKTLQPENAPCYRPPKTYKLREVVKYTRRAQMRYDDGKDPWHIVRLILYDEVWIALLLLTLAGVVLVLKTGIYELLSVVVVGLVLTIVVGWTWWRISITFYAFVRDYAKYGKPPVRDSAT